MEIKDSIHDRVRARDAGMRLLNRLTTGAAVSALVGVGVLGAISAHTIPGTASTTPASTSSASSSTSTSTSSTSASSSSGLQAPSTPVSSSAGSGVAVSGGS